MRKYLSPTEKARRDLDNFEPDEDEVHRMYDNFLDAIGENDLQGMFANYSPSQVLKEIDPTAYRCGCVDWLDSELRNNPEIFDGYEELKNALEEAEEYEDSIEYKVLKTVMDETGIYSGWEAEEGDDNIFEVTGNGRVFRVTTDEYEVEDAKEIT